MNCLDIIRKIIPEYDNDSHELREGTDLYAEGWNAAVTEMTNRCESLTENELKIETLQAPNVASK